MKLPSVSLGGNAETEKEEKKIRKKNLKLFNWDLWSDHIIPKLWDKYAFFLLFTFFYTNKCDCWYLLYD